MSILATGIRGKAHLDAFDDVAKDRFGTLDTGALLVYLIDIVSADALPYLAEQFNVDGFKGYVVADTEQKKRDLLARAIELNKVSGAVGGVKVGLELIGFTNVVVGEFAAQTYNGFWNYDGLNTHGTTNWANFVVIFRTDNDEPLDSDDETLINGFINEYKNVRSNFLGIWYVVLDENDEILIGWAGRPQIGGGILIGAYRTDAEIISTQVDTITVNGVVYEFNTITIAGAE